MSSKRGGCKVTGFREMRAQFATLGHKYPKAMARAVYEEAEFIMADSKERYVPQDDGHLAGSGIVLPPVIEGHHIKVTMAYGGVAAPYALAVHEHLSEHSPPSWQDKSPSEINWNIPGTGPKYLEIPFRNAVDGMMGRITDSVRKQTGT